MSGRCEKHDNWRAHLGDLIALEQRFDHLRAELAASEALVDALNTQRGVDAVAAMRAVAEAREEQREACARHVARSIGPCEQHDHECEMDRTADDAVDACRATPLDATPLADQFAELDRKFHVLMRVEIERAEKAEARVRELEAQWVSPESFKRQCAHWEKRGEVHTAQMTTLEAERDALKAELAEMRDINLGQVASFRQQRDALKAQVERLTGALTRFIKAHGIQREDDPAWSKAVVDMYEFERAERALKEKTP